MTSDELYNLSTKFWQKVIDNSVQFKGREKSIEAIELRYKLATLDVGRAIKAKLVNVVHKED